MKKLHLIVLLFIAVCAWGQSSPSTIQMGLRNSYPPFVDSLQQADYISATPPTRTQLPANGDWCVWLPRVDQLYYAWNDSGVIYTNNQIWGWTIKQPTHTHTYPYFNATDSLIEWDSGGSGAATIYGKLPIVINSGDTVTLPPLNFTLAGTLTLGYGTGNIGVATGDSNLYVGDSVGGKTTVGKFNTVIGQGAFQANDSGMENTGLGQGVLAANKAGSFNTAIGSGALSVNTSGNGNIAIGEDAMAHNTIGSGNTSVGSLFSNISGLNNTGVGGGSLNLNTTGNNNTGMGYYAGAGVRSASDMAAFGHQAARYDTGAAQTAVGSLALTHDTAGSKNTALGWTADVSKQGLTNATMIGANAKDSLSNSIRLGDTNVTLVYTSGTYKTSRGINVTAGAFTDSLNHAGTTGQVLASVQNGASPTWQSSTGGGAYGDGSDGVITLDGTHTYTFTTKVGNAYTLLRDIFATNIIVYSNVTLATNNYRIFANGTVTDSNIIFNSGAAASGITGGASIGSGSLVNNVAGVNGRTTNGVGTAGTNAPFSYGGNGGNGGAQGGNVGGTGGAVTLPPASAGGAHCDAFSLGYLFNISTSVQAYMGGASGASGASAGAGTSGGGGAGGGIINIHAYSFVFAGTGSIQARGGAAGDASGTNAGGGGGGGGGAIILEYHFLTPASPSTGVGGQLQYMGGALGTGIGTGSNGTAGSDGQKILISN